VLIHECGSSNWFNSEVVRHVGIGGMTIFGMLSGGEVIHFFYDFQDFILF